MTLLKNQKEVISGYHKRFYEEKNINCPLHSIICKMVWQELLPKPITRVRIPVSASIRGVKLEKKEFVKVGDKIQLISIDDSMTKLKTGDKGTIFKIDEEQELVWVKWDSGEELALIQGVDKFNLVKSRSTIK